jgi:guanylate kinase
MLIKIKKFIICAPSGAGKTTIVDNAIRECKYHLYKYLTTTTRAKRPEENGDEYNFISLEAFRDSIGHGEFIEWANVYDNLYGLLGTQVTKHFYQNTIGILDVQGAKSFKKIYPDAVTVFIEPPSLGETKKRIESREVNDVNDMVHRIGAIDQEMSYASECDHRIEQGSVAEMTKALIDVIENNIEDNCVLGTAILSTIESHNKREVK